MEATTAFSFVLANFGIAIAAKMPMITTTISSSISVKPLRLLIHPPVDVAQCAERVEKPTSIWNWPPVRQQPCRAKPAPPNGPAKRTYLLFAWLHASPAISRVTGYCEARRVQSVGWLSRCCIFQLRPGFIFSVRHLKPALEECPSEWLMTVARAAQRSGYRWAALTPSRTSVETWASALDECQLLHASCHRAT